MRAIAMRIWCRVVGRDLFEMKTAFMCRRCFSWWRKMNMTSSAK